MKFILSYANCEKKSEADERAKEWSITIFYHLIIQEGFYNVFKTLKEFVLNYIKDVKKGMVQMLKYRRKE